MLAAGGNNTISSTLIIVDMTWDHLSNTNTRDLIVAEKQATIKSCNGKEATIYVMGTFDLIGRRDKNG